MKTALHRNFAGLLALAAVLAGTLACALSGDYPAPTVTPAPTVVVTTYEGAFDCNGIENGLGAYTGRLTFAPQPDVSWTSGPGGGATAGTYDFDPTGSVFTFRAGFVFDSALYDANTDSLVATVTPGTTLAHADGGSVTCVRSQPGITGPG